MQDHSHELRQIEALLEFYADAGVDSFPGDEPVDWYELTAQRARQRQQDLNSATQVRAEPGSPSALSARPAGTSGTNRREEPGSAQNPVPAARPSANAPSAVVPDQAAVDGARDLAASASTLEELRACLEAFEGCNLRQTAKNLVFSDGNPQARLMLVGEAPGREEDQLGKAFVGRSGQLLDRMLAAIGLDRSSAYIANVVPWRPPGNRTPTPQETEICKPFISRQVELVEPDVLVFLGAASAKTMLGVQDGIRKMRGRWMSYHGQSKQFDVMATYHPAYLLRSPLEKRLVWRDFLEIKGRLK